MKLRNRRKSEDESLLSEEDLRYGDEKINNSRNKYKDIYHYQNIRYYNC